MPTTSDMQPEQSAATAWQERRLAAHFNRAVDPFDAGGREEVVFVERTGDEYLIADRCMMFAVTGAHPVLDSRQRYPVLPLEGEVCSYGTPRLAKNARLPEPLAAWRERTAVRCDQRLVLTAWVLVQPRFEAAMFLLPDGRRVAVGRSWLGLVGSTETVRAEFEWYGSGPEEPVLGYRKSTCRENGGRPVVVIMPLRLSGADADEIDGQWQQMAADELAGPDGCTRLGDRKGTVT